MALDQCRMAVLDRPVPNESTLKLMGRAIPMPYATSTSNRSARPAATTFLATQRAA